MTDTATSEDPGYLTIETLAEEVKPFFGQVVLVHRHEMAILEGVGQDLQDLYYIARPIVRRPGRGTSVWFSAVGHCEGLKAYLPEDMHASLVNGVALNGGLPETFIMKFDTGSEVLDYDPETHRELRRCLQVEYLERLSRSGAEEDDGSGLHGL